MNRDIEKTNKVAAPLPLGDSSPSSAAASRPERHRNDSGDALNTLILSHREQHFPYDKKLLSKKGSFTIEAAIFLPIFLIAVLTVSYLVKLIAIQENVFHSLSDEIRNVAAEAEVLPYPLFFEQDVLKRIEEENQGEIKNLRVSSFFYRIDQGNYSEQIKVNLKYDIGVRLPKAVINLIPVSDTIICRAFVGADNSKKPMSIEDIEGDKNSCLVWIFPKSGTKYHKESCTYVSSYPKEMPLNESLRRKFDPCKLCGAKNLSNGSLVYCFQYGDVYHQGSCSTVDKYVISIEKDEAESRGYTPCSKCGGP